MGVLTVIASQSTERSAIRIVILSQSPERSEGEAKNPTRILRSAEAEADRSADTSAQVGVLAMTVVDFCRLRLERLAMTQ